ncbi:MAG: septum formation protein Maf, partial [Clostridiales bacterium]|nr:septum formation protein Maf [Clostridiales bacterium]
RELLKQIGIEYEVVPSTREEKTTKSLPQEIVQELSYQKAEDVCTKQLELGRDDFTVIGADTVVAFMDKVMGKPKSREEACEMLSRLQGNVHQVYTGVTICCKQKNTAAAFHTFFEKTDVSMYSMTEGEITAYVETGEPMDKAGAYGIQGGCAAYIQGVCGDYNNVVGLPIGRLYQEMKARNLL